MAYHDKDKFCTISGRMVSLLSPRPQDVQIDDIAHALSKICRFGGHTPYHMSVAQHSVLVSRLVQPELALLALLHDSTEAYVGDVVSPLKHNLAAFEEVEQKWAKVIGQALLKDGEALTKLPKEIHDADDVAFHAEWASIFPSRPQLPGAPSRSELPMVVPMEAAMAKALFLSRWGDLQNLR